MVIVCSALALCNSFELLGLIFTTFKRRKGLYFWSISIASFGVIPYCVGWLIVHFDLTYDWIGMAIDSVGWVLLISGQSVVLYSRLHLVLNDLNLLRAVLWVILINALIWHTSITVLLFGSSYGPKQVRQGFSPVFNVLEKKFFISGLYIWKTVDILKTAFGGKRRFMWQVILINVIIVAMDIALLAIEYKSFFLWEQGIKVVMYSIKLKLEFVVLGELIEFVQHRGVNSSRDPTRHNTAAFVEISGSRTQTGDKRPRSAVRPEIMHVEHMETNDTTTTSGSSYHKDQRQDGIRVARRIDV
ncbi:hypothetical protein B0T10DRAFT_531970 [Thelonectria olida]|uniref:DUF7703 domain-containing protein n=1 Tax=Thelonectria olida TaxID=1576542 RepID=A0A9P8VVB8_9HYPO|nr:hypothetical protein B0T10DRAFT_531970 [Thelonectria olida]